MCRTHRAIQAQIRGLRPAQATRLRREKPFLVLQAVKQQHAITRGYIYIGFIHTG